ncbi:MAG: hypothetical protein ACOYL6_16090 [Bacteriovoracaceae bacterium]
MIRILLIALITFSLSQPIWAQVSQECETALKTLFEQKVSQETIKDFIHLQSQITSNRLAWTYLHHLDKNDPQIPKFESVIINLINEKYSSTDPDFIQARDLFEQMPLSRNALSKIMPFVANIVNQEVSEEQKLFVPNASDIKLLHLVSLHEKNEKWTANKSNLSSLMNFTKMIDSSLAGINSSNIDSNIKLKEEELQELNQSMINLLDTLSLPLECQMENGQCNQVDLSMSDFFKLHEDLLSYFYDNLEDKILSDHQHYYGIHYGENWVKIKEKMNPHIPPSPTPKKPPVKKKVVIPETPYPKWYQNPLHIIAQDRPGRSPENFKNYDQEYLQNFAHAIHEDQKSFVVKNKLFDRLTGKALDFNKVFSDNHIPLTNYKNKTQEFQTKYANALLNKDKSFIYNEKLFLLDKKGNYILQNPIQVLIEDREKKLGIKRTADNFKSFAPLFLVKNAEAVLNNQKTFWVQGVEFDTLTGRNKLSPFLQTPKKIDYKNYAREKRKDEVLDQVDLIKNYHKDHINKTKCNQYTIVDKKNVNLSIYDESGKTLFSAEILIGSNGTDERTKWTEYNPEKNIRISNKTTGAGIYSVGELRFKENYYDDYKGNLFSINGQNGDEENVLAIHQVPKSKMERYKLFNNGNIADNRTTGGCINLTQTNFLAFKSHIHGGCPLYILPEEAGNLFIVKNDQLNFTTDNKMKPKIIGYEGGKAKYDDPSSNYNFTPKNKVYKKITFELDPQFANDLFQKEYRKPLFIGALGPDAITVAALDLIKQDDEIRQGKLAPEIATRYLQSIAANKEKIMKLYGLDNDDYNDLAIMAFGILGQESEFGTSLKYMFKETVPGLVALTKSVIGNHSNNSRGSTQIKNIPVEISANFPEITESTLAKPENAGIATMGFLAASLKELKSIREKNIANKQGVVMSRAETIDYIIYLYNGGRWKLNSEDQFKKADPKTNKYFQNVKKYSNYIKVTQDN